MKRARVNLGGAIIAVDVRRFGHAINTDEVFGTHSLGSSCDGRVRVDFRSKLGNQKLPFDGREAGFAPNCACWRPESTAFPMLTGTLVTAAGFLRPSEMRSCWGSSSYAPRVRRPLLHRKLRLALPELRRAKVSFRRRTEMTDVL